MAGDFIAFTYDLTKRNLYILNWFGDILVFVKTFETDPRKQCELLLTSLWNWNQRIEYHSLQARAKIRVTYDLIFVNQLLCTSPSLKNADFVYRLLKRIYL